MKSIELTSNGRAIHILVPDNESKPSSYSKLRRELKRFNKAHPKPPKDLGDMNGARNLLKAVGESFLFAAGVGLFIVAVLWLV